MAMALLANHGCISSLANRAPSRSARWSSSSWTQAFGSTCSHSVSSGRPRFDEHVERLQLPRFIRSRRGVQPARRVRTPEIDECLDELGVEEQIAEQLAVRRTVPPDQPVEKWKVGRA